MYREGTYGMDHSTDLAESHRATKRAVIVHAEPLLRRIETNGVRVVERATIREYDGHSPALRSMASTL